MGYRALPAAEAFWRPSKPAGRHEHRRGRPSAQADETDRAFVHIIAAVIVALDAVALERLPLPRRRGGA